MWQLYFLSNFWKDDDLSLYDNINIHDSWKVQGEEEHLLFNMLFYRGYRHVHQISHLCQLLFLEVSPLYLFQWKNIIKCSRWSTTTWKNVTLVTVSFYKVVILNHVKSGTDDASNVLLTDSFCLTVCIVHSKQKVQFVF